MSSHGYSGYTKGCRCSICKESHAAYQKNYRSTPQGKLKVRRMNLKKHGLSIDDYQRKAEAQNFLCAACGLPETGRNQHGLVPLAVDHDHTTGQIRGLLCMRCNRTLGMLKDSTELIQKLLIYRSNYD